jgi:hypothetical protein
MQIKNTNEMLLRNFRERKGQMLVMIGETGALTLLVGTSLPQTLKAKK